MKKAIDEQQAKSEWDRSPALQKEFPRFSAYYAYKRAAAGRNTHQVTVDVRIGQRPAK
jgi:hypothetical protein